MRSFKRVAALFSAALGISVGAGSALAGAASTQPSVWEHHETSTSYFGQTTAFTCSGLEDTVKQVLLYLGARPDLQVHAACPDPVRPVKSAVVNASFYSLQPAPSGASDTVSAQWVPVELAPQRPRFMSSGECELVDQFKSVFTKGFSFRDLNYHAACFPHDVTLLDYRVRGQVLKAEAPK